MGDASLYRDLGGEMTDSRESESQSKTELDSRPPASYQTPARDPSTPLGCNSTLSTNREVSCGPERDFSAVITLGGRVRGVCLPFPHAPWAPWEERGGTGSAGKGELTWICPLRAPWAVVKHMLHPKESLGEAVPSP